MKQKIVAYKTLPADVTEYLREHLDVTFVDGSDTEAFTAALEDADGAIGASVKVTPAMLEGSRIKALSTISVGYDQFDVPDLTKRGIVLAHTPDVLTESTADTVFSLILASARRVVELADWSRPATGRRALAPRSSAWTCRARRSALSGSGASAARSRGARRWAST